MINNPIYILIIILIVQIFWLKISRVKYFEKFFDIIPVICWLFVSGMVLANTGVIERGSAVYQQAIDLLLPAALFLMLVTVDVRTILHLGPTALTVFFGGMFGVMVGMVVGFAAVKGIIGSKFADGFGALTGSWTGGSANMIAVKEALSVPDDVFTLMLLLDSTIPYVWMGFLIYLQPKQHQINHWLGAHKFKAHEDVKKLSTEVRWPVLLPMLAVALGLSLALNYVTDFLPVIKGVLTPFVWTIIIVTVLSLSLGVTQIGRWAQSGIGPWGQWVLFFVLICIGTKGDLSRLSSAPWLFLAGLIAVTCHAVILLGVARLVKAPLFLIATASQANLGGVASASMLAEIYRPGMAGVGLLLAILGNIVGTYGGILVGQICRLLP